MRGQQNSPHLLVLGWDSSAICFPSMASQPMEQIDGAREIRRGGAGPVPRAARKGWSLPDDPALRDEQVKNLHCLLPSPSPGSQEPHLTFSQRTESKLAFKATEVSKNSFSSSLAWPRAGFKPVLSR